MTNDGFPTAQRKAQKSPYVRLRSTTTRKKAQESPYNTRLARKGMNDSEY